MPTSARTAKKPRKKRVKKAPSPVFRVRITTRRGCLVLRYAIEG